MSKIKIQLIKLYSLTTLESLSLGGASWVALLAARGYSIAKIGVIEAIFHCVSLCGEIPSGLAADVLGRKRTMIASRVMSVLSAIAMIFSDSFWGIAVAVGMNALSYNMASGTREALAYDSLKKYNKEADYNKFASTEMMIYRIGSGLSTLFAGVALYLGYKKAYSIDISIGCLSILVALLLMDVTAYDAYKNESVTKRFKDCIVSSVCFLKKNPKAIMLIAINSLTGAIATLLLFFLQAKLPILGLHPNWLGPALFIMQLGAALGAKLVQYFSRTRFIKIIAISITGIIFALASLLFKNPYLTIIGGFIAAFSDDFMQVRADIILNDMIPSEQRATLVSVCLFAFSVVMIILSPLMGMLLDII